jgi:short-subunit dehydrogenase
MSKVLITGATSGIGESLAAIYAGKQNQVFACGRNQLKLEQLQQNSPNITALAFDITNKQAIADAGNAIDELDILILNAGDCEYINDAKNFDGDLFARIINTNLIAIGHLLQILLPKLNSGGQLVLVSSSVTILALPRSEAYGASKAGLDYLADSLRIDLASHNIGVTLVHPGFIATPLTDKNTFAMPFIISSDEAAQRIYKGVAAKKWYLQFPKRFILLMKIIALLPKSLWLKLVNRGSN